MEKENAVKLKVSPLTLIGTELKKKRSGSRFQMCGNLGK